MSRTSRRTPSRLAVLAAGTVLGVATLAGANTAHATTNVTDNQATILRVGGAAVTGSTSIPSGRTLTPVQLITSDPATTEADATSLLGFVPGYRIGRTQVPARAAETVTFRINGTVVSTSVPDMRATSLQTNAGPVPAVVFTAGGVTYAIPRGAIGSATSTVAPSTVNTAIVSSLNTHEYGLLPVGAQTRVGIVFTQQTFDDAVIGSGTAVHTVLDADNTRHNASAVGEELIFAIAPSTTYTNRLGTQGTEVTATVSLDNGATVAVRGLRFTVDFGYGSGRTTWLFDRAGLASAGATIADVTGVVSFTTSAHTLTWHDLGFDLT